MKVRLIFWTIIVIFFGSPVEAQPYPMDYLVNSDGNRISVSILSFKQMFEAFKFLKEQRDIPFDFVDEGCISRAYEAARRLETDKGIRVAKILVEGVGSPDERSFTIVTRKAILGRTFWFQHVAIELLQQLGGDRIEMVLDPSLFDGPVTRQEWLDRITSGGSRPYRTLLFSRYLVYPGWKNPGTWDDSDLFAVHEDLVRISKLEARKRSGEGRQIILEQLAASKELSLKP